MNRIVKAVKMGSLARISFLTSLQVAVIFVCVPGVFPQERPNETGKSTPQKQISAVHVRLEVEGVLRLAADHQQQQTIPMAVRGQFRYDERFLENSKSIQTARSYQQAVADIQIGRGSSRSELPQDIGPILVDIRHDKQADPQIQFRRPDGPMNRERIDLLDMPASSALIDRLLPEGVVRAGTTWKPADSILPALLSIDSITQHDVQCRLTRIDGKTGVIQIYGNIQGAASGVATVLDLNGTLKYSTDTKRTRSLRLTIQEERSIGPAEPGFRVTAQLEMTIRPLQRSAVLSDSLVQSLPKLSSPESNLLEFHSKANGMHFLHDVRWQVVVDREDVAIFRLIDRGDLVAQCNVSPLAKLSQGNRLTLKRFQQDVSHAVKEHAGRIVEKSEYQNPSGLNVLRVVATGIISEVSIHWIYYHLTDPAGKRASKVFILESDRIQQFAESDRLLIDSFRFVDRTTTASASSGSAADR